MVSFASAVPAVAPLVVRSKGSTKALHVMLVSCAVSQAALVVAVPLLALWSGSALFLVVVPLLVVQLWLTVVIVREYQGLLGPQLAADHAGVWVRTGLGTRPEVVFLPWHAIDGIDATRKGPVVRIMSRAGDGLYAKRPHWRVRSLRRRFGTAFIVDGRRSATPPDHIVAQLHQVSVSGGPRP
ncbi:MAG: hypothetical protein GEV28_35660 [Actinophytocola sp.]|uniref:hypothetical protein n=1 Tax=Actinophytocola sp. TaxID=1872138 RepID=UPI001327201A|nr:hypothetical protein [Actinophytocola sp.]MPZ85441.1 hypothetical protein [Actinophytocola sp.]